MTMASAPINELKYGHGFYIDQPVGNNAFSFAQRTQKRIYVPALIKGTPDDLQSGEEIAFSEVDSSGLEINCRGLKNFIHLQAGTRDVFIFDNHNHAFFFWAYALKNGKIPMGLPLVHVDQHRDTREPPVLFPFEKAEDIDLSAAFDYTNFTLNVGNFIAPALAANMFSRVEIIDSRTSFEKKFPEGGFVLDLDMDVFSAEMGYIEEGYKRKRIRTYIKASSLVTIATSPFFMDQERAIYLIKTLFD